MCYAVYRQITLLICTKHSHLLLDLVVQMQPICGAVTNIQKQIFIYYYEESTYPFSIMSVTYVWCMYYVQCIGGIWHNSWGMNKGGLHGGGEHCLTSSHRCGRALVCLIFNWNIPIQSVLVCMQHLIMVCAVFGLR